MMSSEILLSILHNAEAACASGDYVKAENLYTDAIAIDESNPALFGNRSVVQFYLHNFAHALKDAEKAIEIDPEYSMGYYRLGVALQCLQRYISALVAFAKAMSLDSKNFKFLQALIDTALKSPLQDSLKPVLKQLDDMNLERNPFVVISVIGQDLLAHDDAKSAAEILECATTIGTCSLKLKGSVCSALSSALWTLESYERAIYYMKEDLKVSQALSDTPGECRAYGNLAAAYFHQHHLQQALDNYKKQLLIAETLQHMQLVASANSGLGSVYAGFGQHQSALLHHERATEIYGDLQEVLLRCRELGKVAQTRMELGDEQGALRCQKERLRICAADIQNGGREEAQAYSDVANVYKAMQKYDEEIACLQRSANLFRDIDAGLETKTLLSLGHSARMVGQYPTALSTYARLIEVSLQSNDTIIEGRSCANLGVVHHQMGEYETALKFQARALHLAEEMGDIASQGRAYGNMGNAYSALGLYQQAVEHHLKELEISRSIGDKECECSTHGNLAAAYQALHIDDDAALHYQSQLELAKEIGNLSNESRALMSLGNFYNTVNKYELAIEFYKKYLGLSPGGTEAGGRGRALYNLGFACFSLRDYEEAVDCYDKSVAIATECQDRVAMARAYCNLGLARKALGEFEAAIDCQRFFLTLSRELGSTRGELKALGNLGDVGVAKRDFEQAASYYEQQLELSERHNEPLFTAQACSSCASALRSIGQLDRASELLAKESEIYRSVVKDPKNEYKAQGRLGATLTALGRYNNAVTCYKRQLEISQSTADLTMQTQAWGNIAITYINLQDYASARKSLENQIEILDRLQSKSSRTEMCRAHCSIADCCEATDEHKSSVCHNEIALSIACELTNLTLMERACRGLATSLQHLADTNGAVTFAEHRLKICQVLGRAPLTAAAFGELAYLYSVSENFPDALHCLNQQMKLAVEMHDENLKSDAACGLGGVYLLMKDFDKALTFHKLDLELAQRNNDRPCQGRAFGNIAATYEAMKEFASAIPSREQHLFIAKEQDDELAKLVALHGIGRNSLQLQDGDYSRAVLLLQQAMLLCHGVSNNDEMMSTVHDLGIATWACGDAPTAATHLRKAVEIGETVCLDAYSSLKRRKESHGFMECYKLLSRCHSSLLCLLAHIGDAEAALETAEMLNSFPDRLLKCKPNQNMRKSISATDMMDYATKRNCAVIYYVISAGYLFQWLISPNSGIAFAGPTCLAGDKNTSILSELLSNLRDTLGVACTDDDTDTVQQNVASKNKEKSLYLQMLSASNSLQYDNTHISTGKGCLLPTLDNATKFEALRSKPAFSSLHELLLSKVERQLKLHSQQNDLPHLMVVAGGELVLVPFSMLKKRAIEPFLGQQFVLNMLPSFEQTLHSPAGGSRYRRCLTVANPLSDESSWSNRAAAEEESQIAGRLFGVESKTGLSKSSVTPLMGSSEVVHFACATHWGPRSGVVLGNVGNSSDAQFQFPSNEVERPLLTESDILNRDLSSTKLVVLGSPYLLNIDKNISKTAKLGNQISGFVSCLLSRGARGVLLPLWPVPETASKVLLQTFFKHLAGGRSTAAALAVAMDTVRSDARFEHPSYWAGFVLVGQDLHLDPGDVSLVHAMCELVCGEPALARDTIKLLVHLVGKSLKSDPDEGTNDVPTYTSQESVSARVRDTRGWRELFAAAGFELRPSSGEIPDAIFFPQLGDDAAIEKLTQHLAPFLTASDAIFRCYGKLTTSPRTACSIAAWLCDVMQRHEKGDFRHRYEVERRLWQTDGASELLACLGFALEEIHQSSVKLLLRSPPQIDVVRGVVTCVNLLFGNTSGDSTESNEEWSRNGSAHDIQIDPSFALSSIVNKMLTDYGMDSTDFNSSFRSTGSTSSSNRLESSTSAGNRDDFGVLPLEEPKVFTQVPKNPDLIAPKPIMPQKSRLSTPDSAHSAPGGGFSPSKKFVFASPLGSMLESHGSELVANPKRPLWTSLPSTPAHPSSNADPKSTGDFHPVGHNSDPKICVVSPQREGPPQFEPPSKNPPSPPSSTGRYMTVFENMLTDSVVAVNSRESVKNSAKSVHGSTVGGMDLQRTKVSSSESSNSYKPSPSAASSIRTISPQREYAHIVDKLSHRIVANQKAEPGSHDEKLQRSNTSRSHTAFRLVNQSDSSAPPKLQKYLVETHVSTVSTLLSEDAELPTHVGPGELGVLHHVGDGDFPPKQVKPSKRQDPPESKPSFFKQLGALSVKDDRVQFV